MRIALATVGTAGDIVPFAILARSLVERGHQVTAITWPVHRRRSPCRECGWSPPDRTPIRS